MRRHRPGQDQREKPFDGSCDRVVGLGKRKALQAGQHRPGSGAGGYRSDRVLGVAASGERALGAGLSFTATRDMGSRAWSHLA
jgi:hypothetical protein